MNPTRSRKFQRLATILVATAALLATFAPDALAARPGAIFSGQFTGQRANIDPIVSPGGTSAHEHTFYGAVGVDSTETSAELRAKPTTWAETSNHTATWLPTVKEDGVVLKPGTTSSGGGKHVLIYYRCVFSSSVCASMQAFPEDTRIIEGNANATSEATNPAFQGGLGGFRCGTGGGTFYPRPPATCDSGVLVISFTFGACINAAGTEHRDPVSGGCPTGFRPAPRLQQYFRFWVGTGPVGTITLGDRPYYTAHSDYFFGWDTAAFENFMNTCIRVNRDCGTNPSV